MADEKIIPQGAYVYAILVDGVVRYIGKGRRYRSEFHVAFAKRVRRDRDAGLTVRTSRFYNRLARAFAQGSEIASQIIVGELSDEAAFERERQEIASLPEEQLWNELEGGEGLTSKAAKARWANPETRSRMAARWDGDLPRVEMSNGAKERWGTESYRQNVSKGLKRAFADPDYKEGLSKRSSERWSNPQYRENSIAKAKETKSSSDWRAGQSARTKAQWADPAARANLSAKAKARYADPEWRAKQGFKPVVVDGRSYSEKIRDAQKLSWTNPQRQEKHKASLKAQWSDPEWRERQIEKIRQGLAKRGK